MPLHLARLPRNVRLTDANGAPTREFQQWWQRAAESIEAQFGAVDAAIAAQEAADAANAAVIVAQAAADAANTAAADAQAATDAVTAENNLVNSYVTGLTLGGSDAGASATVSISAHTRVYGDGTTVSITGANITGITYSEFGYVYYVDATRADTTPTFLWTTDPTVAAQTGDTHLVGSVTAPAAAAPPTTGETVQPPGVGDLR